MAEENKILLESKRAGRVLFLIVGLLGLLLVAGISRLPASENNIVYALEKPVDIWKRRSPESKVVGRLKPGTPAIVLRKERQWILIKTTKLRGWVHRMEVSETGKSRSSSNDPFEKLALTSPEISPLERGSGHSIRGLIVEESLGGSRKEVHPLFIQNAEDMLVYTLSEKELNHFLWEGGLLLPREGSREKK